MQHTSASPFYIVKLAENEFKQVSKAADDPDCSVMPPLDLVGLVVWMRIEEQESGERQTENLKCAHYFKLLEWGG
jgi:hypothetical protein